jgi:hypothetical protein
MFSKAYDALAEEFPLIVKAEIEDAVKGVFGM